MPVSFLISWGLVAPPAFDWGILKQEKFDIPVVCIGNITVGGTGKTPMAEMVIAYMAQRHHVALISRGYGRRTKGYIEVTPESHYREVGTSRCRSSANSRYGRGRARNGQRDPPSSAGASEVDLVVMDDGFQHRYVEPKVNIVMIDATRPVQHDRMLPAGNLRDLPEQLHRAHYFIVTKCPENMAPIDRRILRKVLVQVAYQRVYFTRFESFRPRPLFPEFVDEELNYGQQVIAMSGIGNPGPFVEGLRNNYKVIEDVRFDDHHVYRVKDMKLVANLLAKHPKAAIIMTEKDAVKMSHPEKIPAEVRKRMYFLPINISFIDDSGFSPKIRVRC